MKFTVAISDFGLSFPFKNDEEGYGIIGTDPFILPEVMSHSTPKKFKDLKKRSWKISSDIWSLGISYLSLIDKTKVEEAFKKKGTFKDFNTSIYTLIDEFFSLVDEQERQNEHKRNWLEKAKSIIKNMLVEDDEKRLKAEDVAIRFRRLKLILKSRRLQIFEKKAGRKWGLLGWKMGTLGRS